MGKKEQYEILYNSNGNYKGLVGRQKRGRGGQHMILSVSRRTDIPGRYADWFMNRIRAGFVLTQNPMNPAQVQRLSLSEDTVDCIVFWTKDAAPLLPYLDELDRLGYAYYFQFTLTPYPHALEPGLRPKREIVPTFRALSERVGRERVVWRYDPILLSTGIDTAFHKQAFRALCERLSDCTDTVTISFLDVYQKIKTVPVRPPNESETAELAAFIGETARRYGLRATACCEAADLTVYGISRAACIDKARIERICGCALDLTAEKNQRGMCGCSESVDIGVYDTCPNGCVYCYANRSKAAVEKHRAAYDPNSPLLCGVTDESKTYPERRVRSNKTGQTKLF